MVDDKFDIVYTVFRHYSNGITEILGVYENEDEANNWVKDDWNYEVSAARYYTDGGNK